MNNNWISEGMTDVVFSLLQTNLIQLQGRYSIPVVVLSIVIACVASFTALSMNKRVRENGFFHHNLWRALGAIAMGFGIWSMHFIGMEAFLLPVEMYYDPLLTIFSVVPAMLASYLAFYISNRQKKSFFVSLVAGVFMGLGISTMHYVGMSAMKMEAIFVYDTILFVVSILVAIFASFIALLLFSTLNRCMENYLIQMLTAVILGVAVSSMHYIGMFAITYHVDPDYVFPEATNHLSENSFIVISVTIGMALLISLLFLSSIIDRYVKYRTYNFDSLTILPNRRHFEKMLKNPSTQRSLAIWHVHDLERVNREYGYLFGDKVLQHVAYLMTSLNTPMTMLYRIEGNRFAFLKNNIEGDKDFREAMGKIAEMLRKPIIVEEKELVLPVVCAWQSVREESDVSKIYSNVLAVLNYPSIQYEHEVIQYDPDIHTYTFDREIADDVERAMKEQELYLVYQPKVNGRTNEITGAEALLRWNHPTYGMLSPGVFIPILEKNDRMIVVTDWIIEKTCLQISEWCKKGISFGPVAINIPGEYVTSSRLLKVLKRVLSKYNLEPDTLELEIIETSFMKDVEEATRAVSVLRNEGFSVALDDFGTGVSSLSYLRKIPISTLKIDKSFVDGVPQSKKDSSIIQAIIALGGSLDLSIVFEGVETEEQATFLASTCERPIIQGYYFAKPMMPDELLVWRENFNH